MDYVGVLARMYEEQESKDHAFRRVLRAGREPPAVSPMRKRRLSYRGPAYGPAMVVLGKVFGVAVVLDIDGKCYALGANENIDDLHSVARSIYLTAPAKSHDDVMVAALHTLRRPTVSSMRTIRAYRVDLLHVQHLVCEHYPGFRVWRPGGRQPDQAEVWLKPRDRDGRLLGGVVWTKEYYCQGIFGSMFG